MQRGQFPPEGGKTQGVWRWIREEGDPGEVSMAVWHRKSLRSAPSSLQGGGAGSRRGKGCLLPTASEKKMASDWDAQSRLGLDPKSGGWQQNESEGLSSQGEERWEPEFTALEPLHAKQCTWLFHLILTAVL